MQIAAEDNKKNDQRRADGARINRRGEISALLADYGRFYPQRWASTAKKTKTTDLRNA